MLTFEYSHKPTQADYTPLVEQAIADASTLLNNLPDDLTVVFTKDGAEDTTGVGGFSESRHQFNLALTKGFHDRKQQMINLRAVVFHELYHMNQGFTFEDSPFTALDSAIYEGCAVRFEQEYGGGVAAYGDYHQRTEAQLQDWLEQLRSVGTKYFEDRDTWQAWAFYHPELKQKWIIYKVGSWLVDTIIRKTGTTVVELQNMTADEIIALNT